MDRLLLKRSLVAASGLALMLAATGCRDRNLSVPPPAHYTDGTQAIPEAVPYADSAPLSSAPSAIDPYAGASLGTPRSFDPAATQTSSMTGGFGDPYGGASAAPTYDPSAGYGGPPVPGMAELTNAGPFASPSSPAPYAADPYASGAAPSAFSGMDAGPGASSFMPPAGNRGVPELPAPAEFPGLDGLNSAPPIPDDLPEMP